MPLCAGDWFLDNFFKPPVVMDLPKYLHDCYYFYYSSCRKGGGCPYRHEVSALGHENVCDKWTNGQCHNEQCHLRHMIINNPRSSTPCFFENTSTGCMKTHCVFMHKNPKPVVNCDENGNILSDSVAPKMQANNAISMGKPNSLPSISEDLSESGFRDDSCVDSSVNESILGISLMGISDEKCENSDKAENCLDDGLQDLSDCEVTTSCGSAVECENIAVVPVRKISAEDDLSESGFKEGDDGDEGVNEGCEADESINGVSGNIVKSEISLDTTIDMNSDFDVGILEEISV